MKDERHVIRVAVSAKIENPKVVDSAVHAALGDYFTSLAYKRVGDRVHNICGNVAEEPTAARSSPSNWFYRSIRSCRTKLDDLASITEPLRFFEKDKWGE